MGKAFLNLQKKMISHKTKQIYIITFILFVIIAACQRPQQLHKITFNGKALGTYYTIHIFHTDTSNTFRETFQHSIDSTLDNFNSVASIYNPHSIISKINQNTSYETNQMFVDIFNTSMEISQISSGAFDITIGPLVNAWGFGFTDSAMISDHYIDSILSFTGNSFVRLKDNSIEKDDPRVMLDMNGIAKGYAVDLVAGFIESKGIDSYIVEIGGEIKTGKKKPDGSKWIVAIEKPAENASSAQEIEEKIYLENEACATSGTYRRYYEKNGERYSHTINPKTGYPVTHNLISTTIIAPDCMTADALATACMVLGPEDAANLIESLEEIEAYFIIAEKGNKGWKIEYTSGFKKYLSNE